MATDLRITQQDNLTDVAFKVCTALNQREIRAVLCGGSAAEVYVPQTYKSGDVDFIVSWLVDDSRVESIVDAIGYKRKGRIFVCESNPVTLDFPSDTLMIWDEAISAYDTLTRGDLVLHVQTPYDTVRDRLCWFFMDRPDYQAMQVAVAVAKTYEIDLTALESWADRIGESNRFKEFRDYLLQ
jgi:hypothetical protein